MPGQRNAAAGRGAAPRVCPLFDIQYLDDSRSRRLCEGMEQQVMDTAEKKEAFCRSVFRLIDGNDGTFDSRVLAMREEQLSRGRPWHGLPPMKSVMEVWRTGERCTSRYLEGLVMEVSGECHQPFLDLMHAIAPPLDQAASAVGNSASTSVQANPHTEPTTTPQQETTGQPPPYRPPRHRSPASRASLPAPAPGPPYFGPVPTPGHGTGFSNPAPGYCNYPGGFPPAGFDPRYFPPGAVPVDPRMAMQGGCVPGQRYPNTQYPRPYQHPVDNGPWDSEGYYRNQQWILQHADPLHLRTHPEITRLLDNMLKRQLSSMENPLKHNDSVLVHLAAGGVASYEALIKFLRSQVPKGEFQRVANELETALHPPPSV